MSRAPKINRLTGLSYQLVPADDDGIYRSEAVPGFWLRLAWLWPAEGDPDLVWRYAS